MLAAVWRFCGCLTALVFILAALCCEKGRSDRKQRGSEGLAHALLLLAAVLKSCHCPKHWTLSLPPSCHKDPKALVSGPAA